MKCSRCEHENPAAQKFCGDCGAPLQLPAGTASSYEDVLRSLTEAFARESATGEILRVIRTSPTDVQPVFDAVAESAARLCGVPNVTIFLRDGQSLRLIAHHGPIPIRSSLPLIRGTGNGRAVLDAQTVHIADMQTETDEFPEGSANARRMGHRTLLCVPLMREGVAIGTIQLRRLEVQLFSERQVALLQTFAAQAVIAIENVRLFNETKEALEQQTATAEILRVISSSPTDVQPVFDAIVTSSVRLCAAKFGVVFRFDGDMLNFVAHHNLDPAALKAYQSMLPRRPEPNQLTGTAILERRVLHVHDVESEPRYTLAARWRDVIPIRTCVVVPILQSAEPIGVIALYRDEVAPFSDRQIDLVRTFADQAVIAIENVRLFTELQEKNRALTQAHAQVSESLEQQTATGEILKVISSSPTDETPVFDAIAKSSVRLCQAAFGHVAIFEGEMLHLVAHEHVRTEGLNALAAAYPMRPNRGHVAGRAILDRTVIHVADVTLDPDYVGAPGFGNRATLSVPMLRNGIPIGIITIGRFEPVPFTDQQIELLKTFADQAVIAIENVRLFNETKEALERQTATSEILQVISQSPTDTQPVFEAIVAAGRRLSGGLSCTLRLLDGEVFRLAAFTSTGHIGDEAMRSAPPTSAGEPLMAQMMRTRASVFVTDTEIDPLADAFRERARARGFRSVINVPLLRSDHVMGVIHVTRQEPGMFAPSEIALLQTFADQAVIAIENVRLFTETKEALDRQTATGEILRVISTSPTDLMPVLESVARNAARLCEADDVSIIKAEHDGVTILFSLGPATAFHGRRFPAIRSVTGRAIDEGRTVHVWDLLADPYYEIRPEFQELGWRSTLAVPLLRDGVAIGTITARRSEVRPFSDQQIKLLETFADQAVIAIENVRLFTELQTSNRELTTALEQQTATSEILRVISRSQSELQPVFDAIVDSAARLCHADIAGLFRVEGGQLNEVSSRSRLDPNFQERMRRVFPRPLDDSTHMGRALLERRLIHVADLADPSAPPSAARLEAFGFRAHLAVPMLRGGEPIGGLSMLRRTAGLFSEDQVQLLQTFADQAVIAIENARLLNELQARTEELTRSVAQLTALGEVGRAVSSTLDLETVLTTIVSRAVELSRLDGGVVFEYDEDADEFVHRVATDVGGALAEARRSTRVRRGEGVVGQTALTLEPAQVPDITVPGAYESRLRDNLIESGVRAILAVPMVREGELIGCLVVSRNRPGEFPAETIELLRTFATQSALAIQNARLFREIEQKSRELEAASRHKSEFLANMSHELRTPLNAVIGFSEVLSERMFGELNEKQEEYAKDIHSSGQHLLSLINDILDLSKIEAGKMELELSEFDMPMTIDNALMLIRERAARRGIELQRTVDERVGQIQADERKIRQVLLNLLSNAIKFTPEGGRIDVGAKPVNGSIEVSVSDTGVGIAPKDQEAVFEEFRQVGTADKKVEGTGLGLALSRKFIELHGGRIWVKSQVGQGSTFTFTVPVRRGE